MTRKVFCWKQAILIFAVCLIPQIATTNAVQAQTGYVETILNEPDLFAYWRFDQDTGISGSTAHDSVGNNDGTYVDSDARFTTGAPIGDVGNKAVDFQYSWTAVNVGTLPGFGSVMDWGCTVEMWVKADTGSGLSDGDQCPFGLYDEGYNTLYVNLDERPNGSAEEDRIRVYCSWAGGAGADFDTDVTDGTWTYMAVALNVASAVESERLKIYLAKPGDTATTEYTSTTPVTPLTPPSQAEITHDFIHDLCIGCINTMNGRTIPFEGIIDEVALYTDTLSKSQIDAHWAAASVEVNRPGDANGDGMVDEDDAAALAANWLTQSGATWTMGDFNGDEKVDDADATIMANNWHYGVPTQAVPEPSMIVLLLALLFAGLLCYRR